jgi:predicted MFS family arabinose efflux permease
MRRYRRLWRAPGAPRLIIGAVLLAPGQAAVDVVLLLALHRASGSYAAGGIAVAAFTVVGAATSLLLGRLLDRAADLRLLSAAAVALLVVLGALCVALHLGAPAGALIALAGLAGIPFPPTIPVIRARFAARFTDPAERATAFAFCSLVQDAGFLAGPAAFGALAAAVSPIAGLLASGLSVAAGTLIVATRAAPPPPEPAATEDAFQARAVLLAPLAPVLAAMVCLGGALGALDVSASSFAIQHGAPALAGVLLAASSAGSVAGGLAYGAREWRGSLPARFRVLALSAAALLALPLLAGGVPVMAALLAISGVPAAATLTTAYLRCEADAPAGRRTEAFALAALALNGGVAAGNAVAGQIASAGSARFGFLLVSGCALASAATTLRR